MRKLVLVAMATAACSSTTPPSKLFAPVPHSASVVPGEPMPIVRAAGFDPSNGLPGPTQITWMELSGNFLFVVVNARGVYRLPKYGGSIDTVDAQNGSEFDFVLASGDRVYWNHDDFGPGDSPDNRMLMRAVDGTATTTLLHGWNQFTQNTFPGYQIDDRYLYYLEAVDRSEEPAIRLMRVPLAGGAPEVIVPAGGAFGGGAFASAYLADRGDVFVSDGQKLSVYAAGSTTAKKVADLNGALNDIETTILIACADADYVYLNDGQHFYRVARGGGALETIYTATDTSGAIYNWGGATPVVDADSIYYFFSSDKDGFAVRAIPKTGGTARKVSRVSMVDFNGGPDRLLQDDKNLFILHDYGEVLLLPKTPSGPVQ